MNYRTAAFAIIIIIALSYAIALGDLYKNGIIDVNATALRVFGDINTTTALYAPQICLSGTCWVAWPGTSGGGWLNGTYQVILTNNATNVSIGNPGGIASNLFIDNTNNRVRVGVGTPNNATGAGSLFVNNSIEYEGSLYGPGADVAELINASGPLSAGDVVVADPARPETVMRTAKPYDTAVVGVVSTDPAITLSKSKGSVPLALAGRVPIKASAENGPIRPGDLLTTSGTPGYAMRCGSRERCQGAIVAKSLGALESGTGTITALVMLG